MLPFSFVELTKTDTNGGLCIRRWLATFFIVGEKSVDADQENTEHNERCRCWRHGVVDASPVGKVL